MRLQLKFHVLEHRRGVGGGGGDQEVLGAQARRGAVIEQHAVLAQHDAVARAADRERGEGVGVDEVEEARGVRALHVDLAQGGDIGDADAAAHGARLREHRSQPGCARVDQRPQPQAGVDEGGAGGLMPVVQRQAPLGLEVLAHLAAGERGEGHRLRVRARLRLPDRGDGLTPRACASTALPTRPPIRPWSVAMPWVV